MTDLIFIFFATCFISLMWKWNKTLVLILLLEANNVVLLGSLISINMSGFLIFLSFAFFVSEALVILSSLYVSLSLGGNVMTTPII